MKKMTFVVLGICLVASLALAGDEKPWFDMPNCDICKHMLTTDGMLNAIGWDIHVTQNGAMTLTTVPAEHTENWASAKAAMAEVGEKVAHGETAHLCGFCTSFGALMASGKMTTEEFTTIGGDIQLFSSNDAETVKAIQKHFSRSKSEMEKMTAEMSAGGR